MSIAALLQAAEFLERRERGKYVNNNVPQQFDTKY